MSVITFKHKGNFRKTEQLFNKGLRKDYLKILDTYGQRGVEVLRAATPTDSGKTADSWSYGIEQGDGMVTLYWSNSNVHEGANIAVLLIYGHGLNNGGYVEGHDFVSRVIRPIFKEIADESWREVTRS